ncbi:hypothetical protein FRACYDRAFT_243723 [Fragilariopsis cylindrus CCMP1102]|uniref:Uncharacterized protein n=1 Tax=Fragilariopsis cylindrus CCMP1102 TaxID=635003 RepID=A0A1E7F2R8_9STRA|nr:hypothetical protein FRACYDRAFT_243723 [Fragilariopsis cylindrus CCMP1102]|eukprot:OEU12470.1 hypothetical protein FRACYDRAFT_243723 [Fragilariopsis cylindrus CCMP1102]
MSATLLVALLSSLVMGGEAESNWKVLDTVSLPTPLADNTATYIPASVTTKDTITSTGSAEEIGARTRSRRRTQESATATSTTTFIREGLFKVEEVPARIYISGGCDADSILFGLECESISSKLYGFIPSSDTTMDNTGYVYDPIMNTWTTVGTIPNEYLTSETIFVSTDDSGDKTKIYIEIVPNDSLSSTTFMFDTTTELTTGTGIIDVEVYDTTTITRGDNFVDMRQGFRPSFITEAWPASSENDHVSTEFAFGGHNLFDEACNCFPTSNEITMQQW